MANLDIRINSSGGSVGGGGVVPTTATESVDNVDLVANTPFSHVASSDIIDFMILDSNGEDLSEALDVKIISDNITIESNSSLTGLSIKIVTE